MSYQNQQSDGTLLIFFFWGGGGKIFTNTGSRRAREERETVLEMA